MVTYSGLVGGYLLTGLVLGSGGFSAQAEFRGQANINYDGQLAVARTASISEFDAKVCVEIEGTRISPSAIITTPTTIDASGVPPYYVAFSGDAYASGTKDIIDYTWFFNDMNTTVSGGQTTEHNFDASGEYLVTLRVTDSDGFVGFASRRVKTYSGVALEMPTLSTSGIPSGGTAPLMVDFTSIGTSGVAGDIIYGYSWSFGHGKFSKRQDPNDITYNVPGDWLAVCTIVDSRGVKMADSVRMGVNN